MKIDTQILKDIMIDHNLCDTQREELEKAIEYIGGKPKNKAIEEFFNNVWNIYPIKKGKGAVSTTQKLKLYRIGAEQLARCIDRYKKDMQGTDTKYWKNGSTFFNSGYVDYLDENYKEELEEIKGLRRVVIR